MGRRSRKRSSGRDAPPPPPQSREAVPDRPAPRAASYRARLDEAPQPAWAPIPLTELTILLGILLLGIGFFTTGDRRGVMLIGGVVLVTLSAGELAFREHFAGYRSHSSLLAGLCAILAAIPVWLLPVPQELVLLAGVVVFAATFFAFRRAFVRRSGGLGFRA